MIISAEANTHIMNKMEEKLIELMGKEAYAKFAANLAREAFKIEVDGMAEGEFKNFVLDNFDYITR